MWKGPKAHLKEDGHSRDLLGVCLEAVTQVTAVREVQAHDAVMGLQKSCVHLHNAHCCHMPAPDTRFCALWTGDTGP